MTPVDLLAALTASVAALAATQTVTVWLLVRALRRPTGGPARPADPRATAVIYRHGQAPAHREVVR